MARRRIVDLSIGIEAGLPSDPPMMIPRVDYIDHAMGTASMLEFFPGLKQDQLPGGVGWAVEFLTLCTHSGTHLDAPYHYHPTMDRGMRAATIDEIPLEWCMGNGVLLDFRHKADGERITAKDVQGSWTGSATRSSRWTLSWSRPAPTPSGGSRNIWSRGPEWTGKAPCF